MFKRAFWIAIGVVFTLWVINNDPQLTIWAKIKVWLAEVFLSITDNPN